MPLFIMPPRTNLTDMHAVCLSVARRLGKRRARIEPVVAHFGEDGKLYGIYACRADVETLKEAFVAAFDELEIGGTATLCSYLPEVGHYHPAIGVVHISHSKGSRRLRDELKPVLREVSDEARIAAGPTPEEVAQDEALANQARRVRDTGGYLTPQMRRAITRSVARRRKAEAERA